MRHAGPIEASSRLSLIAPHAQRSSAAHEAPTLRPGQQRRVVEVRRHAGTRITMPTRQQDLKLADATRRRCRSWHKLQECGRHGVASELFERMVADAACPWRTPPPNVIAMCYPEACCAVIVAEPVPSSRIVYPRPSCAASADKRRSAITGAESGGSASNRMFVWSVSIRGNRATM